ncbi:hypothetical protein LOTGIDRAFT_170870 [Lottia gigantea]|uniref:Hcy-binding domain-containing protein n=1 Tax=Lottia gigantea TaxID=225164 RepID=V4BA94_LOTGI|nr:hypothetical protein LOTGIDRAFT_170870 [Lottia gigantea]ESP04366.1 hypothetical protein LOTGIDRAFT_170870 [Lottia gigantea]
MATTLVSDENVVVLDGGTATQLIEMGYDKLNDDPLWSATLLKTNPDEIKKVHKQFYQAGADISITTSYQASVEGFKEHLCLTEHQAIELIKDSVRLARSAADEVEKEQGRRCYVAGSVGPYGACLHDGSEYSGNYVDAMSLSELSSWHRSRLKALVDAGADYIAIETIPALKEAKAILTALEEFPNSKAFVNFSCKDGMSTCHGEKLADCIQAVFESDQVIASGINCTHPQYITSLLSSLPLDTPHKPYIVKPNSGEDWFPGKGWCTRDKSLHFLSKMVEDWIKHGANWIGGCCRIFPADIKDIRQTLDANPDISLKGPEV